MLDKYLVRFIYARFEGRFKEAYFRFYVKDKL